MSGPVAIDVVETAQAILAKGQRANPSVLAVFAMASWIVQQHSQSQTSETTIQHIICAVTAYEHWIELADRTPSNEAERDALAQLQRAFTGLKTQLQEELS